MTASNRSALTNAFPYLALGAAPEQDSVGHYHAHPALGVGHRQHVQQEGQVAPGLGRDSAVAVESVVWGRRGRTRGPSSSG